MTARELIAEAGRRGVTINLMDGGIQAGPPDRIDPELDAALKTFATDIAFILTRGVDAPDIAPIVKIIPASDVRAALAGVVMQKMGRRIKEGTYFVHWLVANDRGDIRVEIRADTEPDGEMWRGV